MGEPRALEAMATGLLEGLTCYPAAQTQSREDHDKRAVEDVPDIEALTRALDEAERRGAHRTKAALLSEVEERFDEPSAAGVAFADEYEKHCDNWRGNKHFGPCEQHQSLAAHFDAHVRELLDGED